MGDKFLNEGCWFQCSNCITVKLKPQEIAVQQIQIEGKAALTTASQLLLIAPGVCPNLPQNPAGPNCVATVITGTWKKFSKHVVGGKNLLLASSEFVCAYGGGTITVCRNGVKKAEQDRYTPFTLSNAGIKEVSAGQSANVGSAGHKNSQPVKQFGATGEGGGKERNPAKSEKSQRAIAIEDLYCPYDAEKQKCKECAYVSTESGFMKSAEKPGSSKKPGIILRENYERDFHMLGNTRRDYKNKFSSIEEEYRIFEKISCGNAAHHILSTKDVFEQDKLKFVVKLANFYGYDVNEPYNCIILPGLNTYEERNKGEFHVKFSQMPEVEKRKFKYYSMQEVGRQWHGGGHGRDFENEHNISCYATEVTNLLYKYMRKETKGHCRIEETCYEQDKQRFFKIIHHVIDLVRKQLILFETDPQKSIPYFVSADAYDYAFRVFNIRVLMFQKVDGGWEASKYVLSRKQGKNYVDRRGRKRFDAGKRESLTRLVAFCEQIDVAYFDCGHGEITLPFTITNIFRVNLNGISADDYFHYNISAVEAEIRGIDVHGKENVLKKRLCEIKGEQ